MRTTRRTSASALLRSGAWTAVAGLFVAGALVASAGIAVAQFSTTVNAASSNATAALAPPTNPAAALGTCVPNTSVSVKVSWTASTSTWADGYEILRATTPGGPYTTTGTVTGAITSTFIDSAVTFGTTYFYVVRATKAAWRSTTTAEVTFTTPSTLCV